MFKEEIIKKLKEVAPEEANVSVSFAPKEFGDYSTNLALILAKREGRHPLEVAEEVMAELKKDKKFYKTFSEIKRGSEE